MEKGKHVEKTKLIEIYMMLLLVATLFISIGYANIVDQEMLITGTTTANSQDGVYITDVEYVTDTNADTTNSSINYFTATMMESNITLGNAGSSITYKVTVYNNTDRNQVFIGVLTDKTDELQYSNTNIGYSVASVEGLTGLEEYVTTIAPGETLTFPVTFSYEGTDTSNNTLVSKINFRFKAVPILELSNEGETYTLEEIYAGYTPAEYEFTVTNYNETKTNTVPMTYTIETTINSPLQAKIYDENGNEVIESILIGGETQETHSYTLKIIWEEGLTYDAETALCTVKIKAKPTEEKYLEYKIEKEFNIDITVKTNCSGQTALCATSYCAGETKNCENCTDGTVTCPNCNGTGEYCETCKSTGEITCGGTLKTGSNSYLQTFTCSFCGSYKVFQTKTTVTCQSCKGTLYACSSCKNSAKTCTLSTDCSTCSGGTAMETCEICAGEKVVDCEYCEDGKIAIYCTHMLKGAHRYCEHYRDTTLAEHYYCEHNYNGVEHEDNNIVTINKPTVNVALNTKTSNSFTIDVTASDVDGGDLTYGLFINGATGTEIAKTVAQDGSTVQLSATGLEEYTDYTYYVVVAENTGVTQTAITAIKTKCSGQTSLCTTSYCSTGSTTKCSNCDNGLASCSYCYRKCSSCNGTGIYRNPANSVLADHMVAYDTRRM